MKKIIISLLAAGLAAASLITSAAADGFAVGTETVLPTAAPYDRKHVEILWSTNEAQTAGAPVVCSSSEGDYVLMPVLNKVNKLNSKDGSIAATAVLDDKVSTNVKGAISDKTMVQPARNTLYAINTDDMSIISSRKFGEISTNCAVDGSLAYFGYKEDTGYKFVCADIANTLDTVWEYSSKSAVTSPSYIGDLIIFGSGNNLVVRTTDGKFVENTLPSEITHIISGKYAVFMTCKDGTIKKIRLENDGVIEEDSLMSCEVGGELTAMAEYNNSIYVGSEDGFFVLDGLNMEIRLSYKNLKNSSAPLICYGNGQRAFTVAYSDAEKRDVLYSILDTDEEQTLNDVIKIIDFTDGHFTASPKGTMYFRTADGKLWAIAETEISYLLIAIKIILTLAILVFLYLIFRAWLKKHGKNNPPSFLSGKK